ncbi:MAG: TatD family hydrolase [Candidatus Brocadiaceae bacterium]|nr:TatD family hydrolase [Candidatus Brocadiaceae bacterium]
MHIIDTHAHLDARAFRHDLPDVLERARTAGVVRILCVGTDLASSRRCVELARRHPDLIRAAVGIHPTDWAACSGDFAEVERLAALPVVVAVGETGMDFHHDSTPPDAQADGLRRHVDLALALDKPLIVHARKSDERVLEVLEQAKGALRGVRHCFDGPADVASRYLSLGLCVAVGAVVTRPGHKRLKAAVRDLPADCLMVETDCPYQSPSSRVGTRNEPAFLPETLAALAAIRGESAKALAESTTAVARRLFFPDMP